MDIDAPIALGMQEHNDDDNQHNHNTSHVYHSESSMNFDYLQGLHADAASSSGGSIGSGNTSYGLVDDSRALDRLLFQTTYKKKKPTTSQHHNKNKHLSKQKFKFKIIYYLWPFVVFFFHAATLCFISLCRISYIYIFFSHTSRFGSV